MRMAHFFGGLGTLPSAMTTALLQGGFGGPTVTSGNIDIFTSGLGLPMFGRFGMKLRLEETTYAEGDVMVGLNFFGLLRRALAGMDDLIFRPIVKLSPFILGFAFGFWGNIGWRALLGVAAVTYVAPSDWYIRKLSVGILSGTAAALLWDVGGMWGKAGVAGGSLGGDMFEGGTGIQRWLFP